MSDEADMADGEIERRLQESLYRMRKEAAAPVQLFDGGCYCGEMEGIRFCGTACRDLFDRDERLRKIRGD